MTRIIGTQPRVVSLASVMALCLFGLAAGVSAQDAIAGTARDILDKNKMALVVVTVDGRLVAETDGGPLPERTQQRRTLGVTIRPDSGLVVISNAAIDPSIGLSGQRARVDDKVVTIKTAKTVFEKVEISYGDSSVIPGTIIKQDQGADVAFILPDSGKARELGKTNFDAIDMGTAGMAQPAAQVVGLSRSSAAYGYMPTVIVGRVTGVFKGEFRTFYVTTAGTAQGIPIFSMEGKPVGITLERVIDNKRSGILGTLAAGSIKVMADLAMDDYEKRRGAPAPAPTPAAPANGGGN